MATERRKRVKTWKEKMWYEVLAPAMFGNAKVGETPAADPTHLIGRVFETTLGDLIDDFSKSHVKLYFQVKNVNGTQALTEFIRHEMARDYVRSQIRRRSRKAEDIATVTTKDGYVIRVLSMIITFRRAQSTKVKEIRKVISLFRKWFLVSWLQISTKKQSVFILSEKSRFTRVKSLEK